MGKNNKAYTGAGADNFRNIENIEMYEEGVFFYLTSGNVVGAIGGGTNVDNTLEIIGTTDLDTLAPNSPVRVRGSSTVLQTDQTGVKFDDASVGDFVVLLAENDVDGDKVYTLGSITLNFEVHREQITDTTDYLLTGVYQEVCAGLTTKGYLADSSQGVLSFRIENSGNADTEVEFYTAKNGVGTGKTYVRDIPRRVGGATPSLTDISQNDTILSGITLGDEIQLFVRNNGGGTLTVKGTDLTTTIGLIQYSDVQATLNEFHYIETDQSSEIDPALDDIMLAYDAGTRLPYSTTFADVRKVITPENEKEVRVPSDFDNIDSTKIYKIAVPFLDMGTYEVEIPAGGLFVTGPTAGVATIFSDEDNHTVFKSAVGGCGTVDFQNVTLSATGLNSQVVNLTSLTGIETVSFRDVIFQSCTSRGKLNNFFQGLELDTIFFGGSPELELDGVWLGGYDINTSFARFLDSVSTDPLFKAGASFVMNSRFSSNMNLDLGTNGSFFDFSDSNFPNPSTIQLSECIITRDGVSDAEDANITPNIDSSNLSCQWYRNQGMTNTFVGGELDITTEVTTSIPAQSTFYDLEGTYTAVDLQHFDSPANGQLRHLGINPREYRLYIDYALDSSPNDVLIMRVLKWDNSDSQFVTIKDEPIQVNSFVGGRDVAFLRFSVPVELDQNDYIKLQIANDSDNTDITAELGSSYRLEER